MRCAFCAETINPQSAWKSSAGRFYCAEFCADSETVVPAQETARETPRKDEIDRQYVERLTRLVSLRQSLPRQATATSVATTSA